MLTVVDLRGSDGDPLTRLPRAVVDREAARGTVRGIVADVRDRGDAAVLEQQERYGVRPLALRVPASEVEAARGAAPERLSAAIEQAAARIRAYHERQAAEERAPFWRIGNDGALVGEESRAVASAGCLAPGGRAPLPSSVLMTAIPARIAGVERVVVCSPPAADGRIHPATLAACAIAGVDEVYAMGGAQAVAALAYGTETVGRVDVIVGPGSIWTTLAKHEVALDVGVDSFAGPTEVVIVADATAPPAFVAADLVAQAEHDPLATALLITPSEDLVRAVGDALEKEVPAASRRDDIESALRGQGRAVLVRDLDHAMAVANSFAPEHLELICADAEDRLLQVRDAGAVFVGAYSPVALGDYVAGTNHVLPTAGSARFASPLRVSHFVKATAVISFGRSGLDEVGASLIELAEAEGLDAHARALRIRLEEGS
ncbi:MAG TPA: histidinol dehydrogenase [Actinomycetota bacterium]